MQTRPSVLGSRISVSRGFGRSPAGCVTLDAVAVPKHLVDDAKGNVKIRDRMIYAINENIIDVCGNTQAG